MDLIKWQLNLVSCNFGLKSYLWFQIELALRARSTLKSRVWFQTKLHSTQFNSIINCGAPAARRPSGAPYSSCERKGDPWVDFLVVIMASGIARGRVRTTTATTTTTTAELANMAAILQKRHTALVYRVLLWYWTSMLWPIDTCQNKVSADHYHMTIAGSSLHLIEVICFCKVDRWLSAGSPIGSRAHVRLTCWKQGRIVWRPV